MNLPSLSVQTGTSFQFATSIATPKRFTFGGEKNAWWETTSLDRQWLREKDYKAKRNRLRIRTQRLKNLDEDKKLKLLSFSCQVLEEWCKGIQIPALL
jgi:hypothetical protein